MASMRQLPQQKLQMPALTPKLSPLGRWIVLLFSCVVHWSSNKLWAWGKTSFLTQRHMRHGEVCQKSTGQSAH